MLMPRGMIHMPGYAAGKAAIQQAATSVYWPLRSGIHELLIHPAIRVEDLFGDLKESRLQEYKLFGDPAVVHRLSNAGIELVGFEALMPERIRSSSLAPDAPSRMLTRQKSNFQ